MAGHRKQRDGTLRPRQDVARAHRMSARVAAAPDEFTAMAAAFDWLRMALRHLENARPHQERAPRHAGQARAIAREMTGVLASRAREAEAVTHSE